MSENLAFKEHLYGFLDIDISKGTLAAKKIFRICYRFFSVYMAMKRPAMGKQLKSRVKGRTSAAGILEKMPKLLESKDSKLNRAKETNGELTLIEQDLVIIIPFR